MPYYIVNTGGDHEVHETNNCSHLPNPENQKDLGWHASCHGAVKEAKKTYSNADGCYYCCNACNTK